MTPALALTNRAGGCSEPDAGDPLSRLGVWLRDTVLPRWAPDARLIPFAEARDWSGARIDAQGVRLRVMTRQVAVYAQAARRGWYDRNAMARGWAALKTHYWDADAGWRMRVGADGAALDTRFDLYDQAFAIYACAHVEATDGRGEAAELARQTVALIDRLLRVPGVAGWRASTVTIGRDQNGHMHYLEALLALHDVAPDADIAARIAELLDLAAGELFDREAGAIGEDFDDDWTPVGRDAQRFEAGHQYEWAWLAHQAALRNFPSTLPVAQLVAFADRHGWCPAHDAILDGCDAWGRVMLPGLRLWPLCEAIRAAATQKAGRSAARRAAARLFDLFLSGPFAGGWIDRRDRAGLPVVGSVPATSLYHLWEAAMAADARGWLDGADEKRC